MDLSSNKNNFGISAESMFFATRYCKSPYDGIGGAVKRHAVKQSLQKTLNNQILDYKAMQQRFMWEWNDVYQVFWNL